MVFFVVFFITTHSETGIINLILQRENPRIGKVKRIAQSWPILKLGPPDLRSEPFTGHDGGSHWSTQVSVQQATVFTTDVQMGTLMKGPPTRCGEGMENNNEGGCTHLLQSWGTVTTLRAEGGRGRSSGPSSQNCPAGADRGGRQEVPVTGAEVWKKQSNLPLAWSLSSSPSLPLAIKGSARRRPSMCVAPWQRAG